LEDICLPTLLYLLEIESFTGWIEVDKVSRIDLHRGQVTQASTERKDGRDALRELLVAGGARFAVWRGTPRREFMLEGVSSTLLEAYQLLDEWEVIADWVLRLVGDQQWCLTGTGVDSLMAELDGESTLRELVAKTGASISDIVGEVVEAKRLGLIIAEPSTSSRAVESPAPQPERAASDATPRSVEDPTSFAGSSFFELLDRARALIKRRDYAQAERAFSAALKLRPHDRIAAQNLKRVGELQRSARVRARSSGERTQTTPRANLRALPAPVAPSSARRSSSTATSKM